MCLDFLDEYLWKGDHIFVHPETRVVSTDLKHSPRDILDYWSNIVFTSNSSEDYSAFLPYARGRLYYVARTIIDYFEKSGSTNLSFCDFATGQGVLPNLLRREMPNWTIRCTEGSKLLCERIRNDGFNVDACMLGNGEIPPFEVKVASLTWTLCNCIRPLDVLLEVRNHISDGGYLVIAESSRLLVPFRKSLRDLIFNGHPADVHPYYFSINTLNALMKCAGFSSVYINRYYDSDVMLVIGRKDKSLPDENEVVFGDSSILVRSFFETYHGLTPMFDDMKHSASSTIK